MWTRRRLGTLVVAWMVLWPFGAASPDAGPTISGGTPEQRQMARWAIQRFWDHELTLPPLEIRFHQTRDGCSGRGGLYRREVVEICRLRGLTIDWAASELLHEMAHGWVDVNLGEDDHERFLQVRGLTTWNDPDAAWEERGFEHAAEIIAWAIGGQPGGIHLPSVPDNSIDELARGYRVLTGRPLPTVVPPDRWPPATFA
ncbi:MAG TPA: hypothetical protein VLA90_03435 [Actinomycetota bacterium]|nr:hypothetical protein [Actinomycetota bacterium]